MKHVYNPLPPGSKHSIINGGTMTNLVDVPLFVDSRATRCVQYADLVAYAMWRKYERGDSEFFDVIADWFDSEGGLCTVCITTAIVTTCATALRVSRAINLCPPLSSLL